MDALLVYLVVILDKIHVVSVIFLIISIIIFFVWCDWEVDKRNKSYELFKTSMIIFLICVFILVFVPNSKKMEKIYKELKSEVNE